GLARAAVPPGGDPRPIHTALAAEIDEALAEDPGLTLALRARVELQGSGAREAARLATERNPGDVRAWLWLADALADEGDAEERLSALRRASAAAPGNPAVLDALARELVRRGELPEALALARQAIGTAPWSPAFMETWSAALEASSRCGEALAAAERALELVRDGLPDEQRAPFRARIARLRGTCGEPRAATP
ncbi:MAG TPA: tetratricopeptide repeat protein, partial [Anaeromyxobacteraceae bacterium]|nr:tetratricopeptide repeat protein [Anaeromyxobacteraceae bacterium]